MSSESKDIRKRKFHCEKEDMINEQKNAMKLQPIGSKANTTSLSDQGSESDEGASDKEEWLDYDPSDIEDEFKPKPNIQNTEEISSDEEEILTKIPNESEPNKDNSSGIPLKENLEEISSDDDDENQNINEKKQKSLNSKSNKSNETEILGEDHMESISSDEDVPTSNSKPNINDLSNVPNKMDDKIPNENIKKDNNEGLSDLDNISNLDDKEDKLEEKKGMEAISSDEHDEFGDLKDIKKANLKTGSATTNELPDNVESVSSADENNDENPKKQAKENCEESLDTKTKINKNDLINDSEGNDQVSNNIKEEELFPIDEIKKEKDLDAISSDEDNWNGNESVKKDIVKQTQVKKEPVEENLQKNASENEKQVVKEEKCEKETVSSISSEDDINLKGKKYL